jgi:hypothetical protein
LYLEPWIVDKNSTKFEKIFVEKMKTNKPQMNIRAMNGKATTYVVPNISIIAVAIIQVQINKNIIHDVLLNWGSKVNIIIEQLKARLRKPKPKLVLYNLWMGYQTTTKPIGLIKDLRIYVHAIPYITTFIVLHNSRFQSFHVAW